MWGVRRVDAVVALGFVLAALAEAVIRYHGAPGLLTFQASGSFWLSSLAVRRRWPLVPICVIAGAGVLGSALTTLLWPEATDGAGVWIFALMLACYSLGAHGTGKVALALGVFLPLTVVLAADLFTRSGWDLVNGVLFVTAFVGLFPTAVGRLVWARTAHLQTLRHQRRCIAQAQRGQREAAVHVERLRMAERLRPTLLEGLQAIAACAESAGDPGEIETSARNLLIRTREEVVALTAPVEEAPIADLPPVDHLQALRESAQVWSVIGAGAVIAGLVVESSGALPLSVPGWLAVPASVVVGAPLALAWRRPVAAVALGWIAVTAYSRLIVALDGSLSETAFALATAFAVAALSVRPMAIIGLAVCWFGQLVGVGTDDPLGEALLMLVCWLGGLALNEVSLLVEQTRSNNDLLARQEASAAARAVVDERLRLAREIHDAVGHSLTVVALQAGAARRLMNSDPVRASEVMCTVATVARSGAATFALDPTPTDLATLIERVRAAGLAVDADLTGEALLDPAQQPTVFRIVQEGLTNVLRHAPGSSATVLVRPDHAGIEIVVSNSAPTNPGPGPGAGRGLAGIRERAVAGAGQASWRRREDGGFELSAHLPVSRVPGAAR